MARDPIPAQVRRRVLVEAGHRCAIPTCRATTTEIAHIEPWAKTKENSFENLIALCPNCHTRYDKKEIDQVAMKMDKMNIGILSSRYGDLERRVFENFLETNAEYIALGVGSDIMVGNALKDELLRRVDVEFGTYDLNTQRRVEAVVSDSPRFRTHRGGTRLC